MICFVWSTTIEERLSNAWKMLQLITFPIKQEVLFACLHAQTNNNTTTHTAHTHTMSERADVTADVILPAAGVGARTGSSTPKQVWW